MNDSEQADREAERRETLVRLERGELTPDQELAELQKLITEKREEQRI